MQTETGKNQRRGAAGALSSSRCFACSPVNERGLHLQYERDEKGAMEAAWIPDADLEGFEGIVHGGIVSTVLDESMAQAVFASGIDALTAELRVRFRQQVSSGQPLHLKGWIEQRNKRMIHAEALLTDAHGVELAHAWSVFLELQ